MDQSGCKKEEVETSVCVGGQVEENEGSEGGAPREESSSPLCCLSAEDEGDAHHVGGRYKGIYMEGVRGGGVSKHLQMLKPTALLLLLPPLLP